MIGAGALPDPAAPQVPRRSATVTPASGVRSSERYTTPIGKASATDALDAAQARGWVAPTRLASNAAAYAVPGQRSGVPGRPPGRTTRTVSAISSCWSGASDRLPSVSTSAISSGHATPARQGACPVKAAPADRSSPWRACGGPASCHDAIWPAATAAPRLHARLSATRTKVSGTVPWLRTV